MCKEVATGRIVAIGSFEDMYYGKNEQDDMIESNLEVVRKLEEFIYSENPALFEAPTGFNQKLVMHIGVVDRVFAA